MDDTGIGRACGIQAWEAVTALGFAKETASALIAGTCALQLRPVLGPDGGESVPLACISPSWESPPPGVPSWTPHLSALLDKIPDASWGSPEFPVFVTGSNFGIDSLLAYSRDKNPDRLPFILPERLIAWIQQHTGWGQNVTIISHACVSASLGLSEAATRLKDKSVEQALVVSFDFLSPFVTGGFHALKILNEAMPAPFAYREFGAIGLGDGAAFVVLGRDKTPFTLAAHASHNEMFHFTSNDPTGDGFRAVVDPVRAATAGRRLWIKGHGTGTLEAGALEAAACAAMFPDAPLVSWKGAIGHTLGSCGAVELVLALEMLLAGRIAGTIGSGAFPCPANVATECFDAAPFDAVLLQSNAFGGAHATTLLLCE